MPVSKHVYIEDPDQRADNEAVNIVKIANVSSLLNPKNNLNIYPPTQQHHLHIPKYAL